MTKPIINENVYWKMAIFKCSSGVIKVALLAYVAGVASKAWSDMTLDAKTLVIIMAIVQAFTYIEAFMDTTATRITRGQPLIGEVNGVVPPVPATITTVTEQKVSEPVITSQQVTKPEDAKATITKP